MWVRIPILTAPVRIGILTHTLLKEAEPSAKALALARRQLIAEEQAPFYWAPFILIGK